MEVSSLVNFVHRIGCGFACATVFTAPALALNPAYRISQYAHTSWRSDAGVQAVRRLKQTPDGYLWLATRSGLLRFDGVRFTTFKAGNDAGLESSTTQDIVVDPDGSMWIATLGGGVSHYVEGKFHAYTTKDGLPSDDVACLYRDSHGALWAGTRGGGVARLAGERFEKFSLGIPPTTPITAFLESPDHSLWIATNGDGVFRVQNGTVTSFTVRDGLPHRLVTGLYTDHSGTIWTAGWKGISSWNGKRFIGHAAVNAVVAYAISCTQDTDGNLWIASSTGLYRAHGNEVTRMDRNGGLSGDFASDVLEDREGNLWVATRAGLDRFRDEQIRVFDQPAGRWGPVVADHEGVWTASNRQITQIAANTIHSWPVALASGKAPTALLAKRDGGFLVSFDDGVKGWTRAQTDSTSEWPGLDVHSMFQASDGTIWIGSGDKGLVRWRPSDGTRTLIETGVRDRFVSTIAEDRTGAIWAGSNNGGGLYRVDKGIVQHFGRNEGLRSADVYTVFRDRKGDVWIGSTVGLSWFQDGRLRTANSQQGLPADQVFAILEDSYDRLWFMGFGGIAAIDKKSLAEWSAGHRSRLNPIVYRNPEGRQVRTVNLVFPNAVRSSDGHLWFAITDGLVEVTVPEPSTQLAPRFPVVVEEVTVDRVPHPQITSAKASGAAEQGRIRIPAGSRAIEVHYTALTLSESDAVRFRYRLDGIDDDWVDAEGRRVAYYNNLIPGAWNFRVAATIDGKEWQESSALVLDQIPFFYQTYWFRLLTVASALSLVFVVYRLRLRQAVARVRSGFQQRLDERSRIARDLHDTLLQSFSGLMLRLQVVDELLPGGRAKEQLGVVLERGDSALVEARAAVYQLRSPQDPNDLAEAVQAIANEFASVGSPAFRLVVEGSPADLQPIVRDEVYRIAREALGNAFRHAQAQHIEAEIAWRDRLFCVRIRDDGRGIPSDILNEGRRGHYGLSGMRERSQQIGAKFTIWSNAGAGTEIDIAVPGPIAYAYAGKDSPTRFIPDRGGEKS
jgi:signal transduction histidine kinase/ligand-binding sensor domain-containing protein